MSDPNPIYIGGTWRPATAKATFHAYNPVTGDPLADAYPISDWLDCDAALSNAAEAFQQLVDVRGATIGDFLERYATAIEEHAEAIVTTANLETGLPVRPRLAEVELPRTTSQLRLAAAAARDGSWRLATIDSAANIRSFHAAIGPVFILGPNNFPLAFNAVSGGDFAAAIAAGNPVIAKAHPAHPQTTQRLFELAVEAAHQAKLPAGTIQLLYHLEPESGLAMVEDWRLGATAFTGSRRAALELKSSADAAGKPIYLEMSSVNPVFISPRALAERADEIVQQFCASCTMGSGQFCTNPGLVILLASDDTTRFLDAVARRLSDSPAGPLFSAGVRDALAASVSRLIEAGGECLTGGRIREGAGYFYENTLLTCPASLFLHQPMLFQTEMFGAASLFVVADSMEQLLAVARQLEGNLTGTIYTATGDEGDDLYYQAIAKSLRPKVGRLISNKMPTGVAVSPAMNHGGPFPSTGHPGFTAVGIPASLRRFTMLQCFEQVAPHRLPEILRDPNPDGKTWRWIDRTWTQGDV